MLRAIVNSSIVRSVGYAPDTETLEVEFQNGRVYRYLEVPRETYDGFRLAPSKGRYFLDCIRDAFAAERES